MRIDFTDRTVRGFAYELLGGLSTQYAGAAELGDCLNAMGRVRNGGFGSWITELLDVARLI